MSKIVIVAGGFDPVNGRGHIEHIKKASKLGEYLIVITHPDEIMVKKKGYCFMPLVDRVAILDELRCVNDVVISIDTDGTVAKTLEMVDTQLSPCHKHVHKDNEKHIIFAKGGDRTKSNMPQSEIDVCQRLGIEIVYGVGEKLGSSQDLVRNAIKQIEDNKKVWKYE